MQPVGECGRVFGTRARVAPPWSPAPPVPDRAQHVRVSEPAKDGQPPVWDPVSVPTSVLFVVVRNYRTRRRRWDLNPRWVSPHTISSRADSAALALLQIIRRCEWSRRGYRRLTKGLRGNLHRPKSRAVVGSRATVVREPSQGRKPAALSGLRRVPRIAWPSLWTPDKHVAVTISR
jgi:hypothetical protein